MLINFFYTDEAVIDELKTSLTIYLEQREHSSPILSVIQKVLAPLASHVTESQLGDRDITGEHLERMVVLIGGKAVTFPSEELPQQPLEIVKLNVPKEAPEGIYERIEKYWDKNFAEDCRKLQFHELPADIWWSFGFNDKIESVIDITVENSKEIIESFMNAFGDDEKEFTFNAEYYNI